MIPLTVIQLSTGPIQLTYSTSLYVIWCRCRNATIKWLSLLSGQNIKSQFSINVHDTLALGFQVPLPYLTSLQFDALQLQVCNLKLYNYKFKCTVFWIWCRCRNATTAWTLPPLTSSEVETTGSPPTTSGDEPAGWHLSRVGAIW